MSTKSQLKNYYEILGINPNASLFEIENAYEKLAAKWHPDKHKEHRKSAQTKFHDISEAFEVLSDRNKRSHYDNLLIKQYNLEDAHGIFEKFFNEHGIIDEEEEKFFAQNYPSKWLNYYKVLGVPRNATLDDIRTAYRKLSLKYHPKNNPNDQIAHSKFIEVNEAYAALENVFKRQVYDDIIYNQIEPIRAHNIFEDFFGNRWSALDDEEILKPIVQRKRLTNVDKLWNEDLSNVNEGQVVKVSSVYSNKNGVESKKTSTTKRSAKQGKVTEEVTEEYTLPNGDRQITKKLAYPDGKVESKKFTVKKGEEVPKQITQ